MDIKQRIQELSLDQKAKLYFMGLVRKGVIDTLPEDPKAAYIRDMMDKEDPKMDPAIRSDFDEPMFENLNEQGHTDIKTIVADLVGLIPIGGDITGDLRNVIHHAVKGEFLLSGLNMIAMIPEPECAGLCTDIVAKTLKYMAVAGKLSGKLLKWVADTLDANLPEIMKVLDFVEKHEKTPDEFKTAVPKIKNTITLLIKQSKLGTDIFIDARGDIKPLSQAPSSTLDDLEKGNKELEGLSKFFWSKDNYLKDIGKKAVGDKMFAKAKAAQTKNLAEIATELGYLNEEVDITYSTPGNRFYKMKVDGKKLKREEGTKYLKDLGIVDDEGKDMEIPRNYDQSILDDIVKALEKKGIKADYNDAMDVS